LTIGESSFCSAGFAKPLMISWDEVSLLPNFRALGASARTVPTTPAVTGDRNASSHAEEARWQSDRRNALRKIGAFCAAALIFIRFSAIHETITHVLGINTYLIYLFALPGGLAWILSGGIRRTFASRSPVLFWAAFTGWMLMSTPLSFWKAAAVAEDLVYLRTVLPLALLVAGLPLAWEECRRVAYGIALAVPVIIITARLLAKESLAAAGRVAIDLGGTISNPNDIAGILVVTLPFVLFIVIRPGTPAWLRIVAGLLIVAGLITLLRTASRGGMLGLFAALLMILVRASSRQRIALLAAGGLALPVAFAALPESTAQRLFSFRAGSEDVSEEALDSQKVRVFLLKRSLEFTVTHPVFGVGPGNFVYYEDSDSRAHGLKKGNWHVPHNAFTQVSSECGIPGIVFYVVAIGLTFRGVGRVHKLCRRHRELKEISDLAFCFSVALSGFCVAVFFLPFGYHAYLPMLGGFSVCLTSVAQRELKLRGLWAEPGAQRNAAAALAGGGRGLLVSRPTYSAKTR
jgi:O-antigen ligase